jgi:release factor glutamine methyltransferase
MMDALQGRATRAEALASLRAVFARARIDSPALDARILLCASGGFDGADLIREPEAALDAATLERLGVVARRRALAREPVSRILGRRGFWSLSLAISPAVLDPRPETETLIEAVLAMIGSRRDEPWRILDLGAGSGAILCALLAELPKASGLALDRSEAAARIARANLVQCGFGARGSVVVGSWGDSLAGPFDLIVSNPPYVRADAIESLPAEVRDHDPRLALDGGKDGLDAYRAIARALPALAAPAALFALEVGAGQAAAVTALLSGVGDVGLATRKDLFGVERVVDGAFVGAGSPIISATPLGEREKRS